MYIKSKVVALILLLLMVQKCRGQRSKSPRFGSKTEVAADLHLDVSVLKCTHTAPEIIESFQCQLTRRNNSNYITITLLLHKPVERFDTNAVFDVLGPTKDYYNIFRSDIDCCAFLSAKKHSVYVVNDILKLIYASINEKPTCPVKADFNYIISELDANQIKMPSYIPKSNFRLGLYFRTDGRRSADVILKGKIKVLVQLTSRF